MINDNKVSGTTVGGILKDLMNERKYNEVLKISESPEFIENKIIQFQRCRALIFLNRIDEVKEIADKFKTDRMIQNIYVQALVKSENKNGNEFKNAIKAAQINDLSVIQLREIKTRIINKELSVYKACLEYNKGKKSLVNMLSKIDDPESEEQLKFECVLKANQEAYILAKIKKDKERNKNRNHNIEEEER